MNEHSETKTRVAELVYSVVDEINEDLSDRQKLAKSLDCVLFGEGGSLDSLGLVNLIVSTEQRLSDTFGVSITLADERAISQTNSPFTSIGSFVEYIEKRLKDEGNS